MLLSIGIGIRRIPTICRRDVDLSTRCRWRDVDVSIPVGFPPVDYDLSVIACRPDVDSYYLRRQRMHRFRR